MGLVSERLPHSRRYKFSEKETNYHVGQTPKVHELPDSSMVLCAYLSYTSTRHARDGILHCSLRTYIYVPHCVDVSTGEVWALDAANNEASSFV